MSALVLLSSLVSTNTTATVGAESFNYGTTTPFVFGGISLHASVADTAQERQLGLSYTPSLPPELAKVFIFEESALWGFWMKDMNYPIDIFWVSENGAVVHIESDAAPESYPSTFVPPVPAKYVFETVSGFATEHGIQIGDTVDLTPFIAK